MGRVKAILRSATIGKLTAFDSLDHAAKGCYMRSNEPMERGLPDVGSDPDPSVERSL